MNRTHSWATNPRLTLVQGDAMALPFEDDSFDHVVCSEVLEHLADDLKAVRELYRVLKPGGTLVVTVPNADFPLAWDPPNWIIKRLSGRHLGGERPWSGIWYGHLRLYSDDSLRQLISQAGFEIDQSRGLTHTCPPFAHLLLYGIGKPLIQAGLVPAGLRKQADRKSSQGSRPSGIAGAGDETPELDRSPERRPGPPEAKKGFRRHRYKGNQAIDARGCFVVPMSYPVLTCQWLPVPDPSRT